MLRRLNFNFAFAAVCFFAKNKNKPYSVEFEFQELGWQNEKTSKT